MQAGITPIGTFVTSCQLDGWNAVGRFRLAVLLRLPDFVAADCVNRFSPNPPGTKPCEIPVFLGFDAFFLFGFSIPAGLLAYRFPNG